MSIRIASCACLALAALSCGRSQPQKSVPPAPPSTIQAPSDGEWAEFTSKEDGFAASFPTTPKTIAKDNQYDFGKVTIRAYTSNPKFNVDFRVATHNFPEPFASKIKPGELIVLMRDGMAANVKGKVEEAKAIELDGYPGQECSVQASDPLTGKPLTIRLRLFAVEGRMYQLGVTAPTDDDAFSDEALRFFKSFRLLKAKSGDDVSKISLPFHGWLPSGSGSPI